jgi:hypothetical protein
MGRGVMGEWMVKQIYRRRIRIMVLMRCMSLYEEDVEEIRGCQRNKSHQTPIANYC